MATRIKHTQSTEVIGTGTFSSAAVIVEGDDFIAENAIFKNSAPQCLGKQLQPVSPQIGVPSTIAIPGVARNLTFAWWKAVLQKLLH
ncbi:pectinesterase 31-like isoform X4 [Panicum virgatum]|uniref:pectinesterase 31-like isoform X4 n=1 Tax=Panicum virgatum TaxID=38727 RepID=UPI0019D582ED|nr:pectinesterase 31-like isoform X4 [Panicum virgatum]